MNTVTLSPKYQLVLPKQIREGINAKPGMKFQILRFGQRIEIIPIKELKDLAGSFPDLTSDNLREKQDRV